MNKTYISLSSLAMDLKRAALGSYNGSSKVADRFFQEALKRREEIDLKAVEPYIQKCLKKIEQIPNLRDEKEKAEVALMYSILFQNFALKK